MYITPRKDSSHLYEILFRYLVLGLQEPKIAKKLRRLKYPIVAKDTFLKVLMLNHGNLDILTHLTQVDRQIDSMTMAC